MYLRLLSIVSLLAVSNAFQASLPRFAVPQVQPSTTARHIIMTDEETEAIMKSAADCSMGECSIDDVNSLIMELKDQEKVLSERMDKIMNMIAHLQHVNEKEERQTDEVRAFVRDMLRAFNTDKPSFPVSGFSGDIGKGPQTAYDALPPKPWKAKP